MQMKKRNRKLYLLLGISVCLSLGFLGCKQDNSPIENVEAIQSHGNAEDEPRNPLGGFEMLDYSVSKEYEYDNEYNDETMESVCYANAQYCLVHLENDNYPKLQSGISEFNLEHQKRILNEYRDYSRWARDEYKESEYFLGPYYSTSMCNVTRADTKVFCIKEKYSDYTGGVHGMSAYLGYVFDTNSGNMLKWQDFFNSTDTLAEILCEKLNEKYDTEEFWDNYKDIVSECVSENTGDLEAKLSYTVGYDGITFYFGEYQLGSYASGMPEITLRYSEYADILKAEYFEDASKDYVVECEPYIIETDVNDDGDSDYISVYDIANEYGDIEKLQVVLNGNQVELDTYGYGTTRYLVKVGGKTFIYVSLKSENDWCCVYVFDLNQTEPGYVGYFSGHIDNISNPNRFRLEKRTDMLSTIGIATYCRVGESGMPEMLEDFYEVLSPFQLISKVDLEAEIVDETTMELTGQKKVFEAGTEFTYVRTDDETYVDMQTEDGCVCRFHVGKEWPQTINGMDAESCFEQLWYAG